MNKITASAARTKPTLIIHADDDRSVPVRQAEEMVATLKKLAVTHRFVHYKDKGHVGITEDVIKESLAFIDENLKSDAKRVPISEP